MECTFTFPVYREKWNATQSFCVREADGHMITGGFPKANADYIVQALNGHEKLLAALKRYGDHEPGCVKGDACNCGFEQALKESEKKQ
jgi:hypothetical protein